MDTIVRRGARLGHRLGRRLFAMSPTPEEIEAGFQARGEWMTRYRVGKRDYGGKFNFAYDTRLNWFYETFPKAKTILEVGSLEGGQTFQLARRRGTKITAIESRDFNIEKARFAQKLLKIKNVEFVQADLEVTPLDTFGQFDAVLCCGVLYHLPRPWEFLDQIRSVTRCVYIGTHHAVEKNVTETINGFPGHWYDEFGFGDAMSGMSPRSFWITLPSLIDRLKQNGFDQVKVFADEGDPDRPFVILAAWVGNS